MQFYLGTHMPHWLNTVHVPLFISHTRLRRYRRSLPRAVGPWALDSGAFGEIGTHGTFVTDARGYVAAVRRYRDEIGMLEWAAPQDHMTEAHVLARSTLCSTVAEAQRWTVDNLVELRTLAPDLPIIPSLQGQSRDDYLRCVDLYDAAGVDLTLEPRVGLGSVCRRQGTDEIGQVIAALDGIRLHGFGVKSQGVARYGWMLRSADSLAWCYDGWRWSRRHGCPEGKNSCANCLHHALAWRDAVLLDRPSAPVQMVLA